MILTHRGLLQEFLWERLCLDIGPRSVAMGWLRRDQIVAALAFTRFSEIGCEVSIYSEGGLPRPLLDVGFRYVFGQCRLHRLTFCVQSDNLPSIRLVTRLGAELEATLAGTHPDSDTLIWVLRPETCSYWRRLNGLKRFRPEST